MNRLVKTSILFLFLSSSIFTQTAIDFTETDINGVEHNLFSYLEDGKVVIIDAFATWCGPCLNFQNTKRLTYLHDVLGPEGQDKIVVLALELDQSTTMDDLYGTGNNTAGDYVTGIPYPIINPEFVSEELKEVFIDGGYPTINVICPDTKEIISTNQTNYFGFIQKIKECVQLPEFTDAFPTKYLRPQTECASFTPAFSVLNGGTELISALKLNLYKDDVLIEENLNYGPISGGQIRNLGLNEHNIDGDGSDFRVEVVSDDDNPDNNNLTVRVDEAEAINSDVALYIETKESIIPLSGPVTCFIKDIDGNNVHELEVELDSEYELNLNLEDNTCYWFTVEGSLPADLFEVIELRDKNQKVLPLNSFLDSYRVINFSTELLDNIEFTEQFFKLDIFPSPVKDILSISIDRITNEDTHIQIIKASGETVMTKNIQNSNESKLDVAGLSKGVYFLKAYSKAGSKTVRFIKV